MALQVTDRRDSFRMWRVTANVSNKICSSPRHKFNSVCPDGMFCPVVGYLQASLLLTTCRGTVVSFCALLCTWEPYSMLRCFAHYSRQMNCYGVYCFCLDFRIYCS